MRAIWTGAIGFGLVNIPVKIYSAVEDSTLDLDMLDKKDHSHIKFKRVNEQTGREVAWDNIVKAYDYEGTYVVLDENDFAKAMPEKSKILSIEQFVKEEEIDSIYYETPYFLEPQKSGEKAYQLLVEALKKTGMAGIGTFVLRSKELLGVIRPYEDNILVLHKIRFGEEIRQTDELNLPAKKAIKPAELKMAVTLIEQLSGPFDSSAYRDTYSDELLKIIAAKAKGKRISVPKVKVTHTKSVDLMAQLRASLNGKGKGKKAS